MNDVYYQNSHIIELKHDRIILSPVYIYNYKHTCGKETCATYLKDTGYILMTVDEYKILKVTDKELTLPLITNSDHEADRFPKGILTLLYMGMGIVPLNIEFLFDTFITVQKHNNNGDMIEYVNYILSENLCEIPNYVGLLLIFAKNNTNMMDLFEFVSNHQVPYITLLNAEIENIFKEADDLSNDTTMQIFIDELK